MLNPHIPIAIHCLLCITLIYNAHMEPLLCNVKLRPEILPDIVIYDINSFLKGTISLSGRDISELT